MKIRVSYALALCCLTAILGLAQGPGLEGNWMTDGVPAFEAAKKAAKPLNGLAEATRIKFKVDEKKGKISGTITQLNENKEYDIQDGKLTDKTFTFKSIEVVPIGNNSSPFGNAGARGGGGGVTSAPAPIPWKGELTDPNTVTLTRLSATGEASGAALVLHRAPK